MVANRQTQLMRNARESASFDPYRLTVVIYDGEETVRSRRAAFQRVESALDLQDNMKLPQVLTGLDRQGLFMEGIRRSRVAMDDMLTHGHRHFEKMTERYVLANSMPFGLHFAMFRKTIELQGTQEQKEYWLPRIDRMEVNGAYCQTELARGTFVRGIETTATFDPASGGFIIDSPTLGSIKYWPAALGYSGSHAIVAARLLTQGSDHGVHYFVVQIRSLDDWSPIDGVELGDVGMKMGYNGTCNGYASFNGLRVPRSSLLAANAGVTPDGTYQLHSTDSATLSKRLYATMLDLRKGMVWSSSFALALPLTIAARYSIVREQGVPMFSAAGAPEVAIVEYRSQHYRIFTLLSQAFGLLFASKVFDVHYDRLERDQLEGNHGSLPFLHALSTGLKAWGTTAAASGATEARKMCGGHGFAALSGLVESEAVAAATATFEGENYVMWQQLGRYLLRQAEQGSKGCPVDPHVKTFMEGFGEYLQDGGAVFNLRGTSLDQLYEPATLLSIFLHRARRILASVLKAYTRVCKIKSPAEAWNEIMMLVITAAQAFVEWIILDAFHHHVSLLEQSEPSLSLPLGRLCTIFALTTILSPPSSFNSASFVEDGLLGVNQLDEMRTHINILLDGLRPDLIALTDAWDFTDASLCSAIGCRDGNAYERLMSWTRQLPANNGSLAARAWNDKEGIKELLQRRRVSRL